MKSLINLKLTAFRRLPVLCFLVMLALSQLVQAQVLYGSLVGRVEDPSGAIVPGAKISVTNRATGQQRDVTADESGSFAIRDLQVGVYDISTKAT